MLAAERYDGAEPVNLGAGREITIRDLVELIAQLTGFDGRARLGHRQPDGQPRRELDTSRAEREFGFRRQVPSFEDGPAPHHRLVRRPPDVTRGAGPRPQTAGASAHRVDVDGACMTPLLPRR